MKRAKFESVFEAMFDVAQENSLLLDSLYVQVKFILAATKGSKSMEVFKVNTDLPIFRHCVCGCGRILQGDKRQKYYSDACKQKTYRKRKEGGENVRSKAGD